MDGGACWAAVHGVTKSQTRLSNFTFTFHFHFSLSWIGEGNGNPLQCSCLENPRDGEAWWAAVYGVAQSRTRLTRLSNSSNSLIIPLFIPFLLLPTNFEVFVSFSDIGNQVTEKLTLLHFRELCEVRLCDAAGIIIALIPDFWVRSYPDPLDSPPPESGHTPWD